MGYFIIIIFSSFLSNPPNILPIAFQKGAECELYLTNQVKNKYENMIIKETELQKYLVNTYNNKFIMCKELKDPAELENIEISRNYWINKYKDIYIIYRSS